MTNRSILKMSPRTEEQLAKLKAQRREQIIKESLQLFAHKGYFNTSISDIATKLKIAKGLLYNYFSSKEELLNEVLEFSLKEAAEMNIPEHDLNNLSPDLIFKKVIDGYFEMMKEKKELWRLITSLAIHVSSIPSVHATISSVYEGLIGDLEGLFVMIGFENPKNEAIKLGALMDGIGIQYLIFGDDYPLEQIKENIISSYIKPK